ncbi:TonB-dependent receptor [Telluribacter sp.]|jgi:iron complex outermembrane receptor protein|uniref:TonB-dependent receptor n=1 Tax=Telluribacter sp. TaxID=1978767 RepID=UPI002E0FFD63|nr:TonB-dependent receptor [Telluribacter sp.]
MSKFRTFTTFLYSCTFLAACLTGHPLLAQNDTLRTNQLEEVTISAYESRRTLLETPAAISLITPRLMTRFAATTWINAVNTAPGVRMEERSPGSYRFSIRGSLLRSPFGVRNVKFYWNGIPFTDASGNTSLNVIDFAAVERMEIIKGPGSSLYGAGTGGVVLLSSPTNTAGNNRAEQQVGVGKYGFRSWNSLLQTGGATVLYGHQQQEGYRDHSAMVRDALTFTLTNPVGSRGSFSLLGMYSDLHYQTPGGINLQQYQTNPRLSRQPTPTLPGSREQQAGVYTRYAMLGGSYDYRLSANWSQTTTLYLSTNDFRNPFISNQEKRTELGLGGRQVWKYAFDNARWNATWTSGLEGQYLQSVQRTFRNLKGTTGTLLTDEELLTGAFTAFSQFEAEPVSGLIATVGLSYNTLRYDFQRFFPAPYGRQMQNFKAELAPRIALLKKIGEDWAVFGSYSQGFSPPTLQEIRPSAGGFRADLSAERGVNREIGIRRAGQKLSAEVNLYSFSLREAIVRRTEENGAEFFINAGKTRQNGVEWQVGYDIFSSRTAPLRQVRAWHNGTYTRYTFVDFQQADAQLSGNILPGIPRLSHTTGLDLEALAGLSLYLTYQHGGSVFLNDANTVEAPAYDQFLVRGSWKRNWGAHFYTDLSASAEWVSAEIYSLGYDLNAFGNRFFNASPKQNTWVGIKAGWRW